MIRTSVDALSNSLFGMANRRKRHLPPITDPILLFSVSTLAARIRHQETTSTELVEACIARIEAVNPILNCVVDRNFEEARALAATADELVASHTKTPAQLEEETPLLGIPFTIKECFGVRGLRHTAGLLSRSKVVSDKDAEIVQVLRAAGAFPLAVTNVSELCYWWESENKVYGRTLNPYDTRRTVGGSSGGEGAINAAAAIPFGVGSDVGGSIRMPSFFNAIFGHKPSPDIVSNEGQIPAATNEVQTYLCTGPMCRYASDLTILLRVMAAGRLNRLYRWNEDVDLASLKVYYAEDDGASGSNLISDVHPSVRGAMTDVVSWLDSEHGICATRLDLENMGYALQIWSSMMSRADSPSFAEHMADGQGRIWPYWELLKFIVGMSNHTFPAVALSIVERFSSQDPNYVEKCDELREAFERHLGDNGVFLFPTHPTPAPFHSQPYWTPFNFAYTAIFNVLGFPATHCPVSLSAGEGLPVGIQVVATRNNDRLTLAVAREIERAFGGWIPPPN